MFKLNRYPFILSAFPEIRIGAKLEITFKDVKDLLALNLVQHDFKKVAQLLQLVDLDNIRAFWMGLPLSDKGSLNAKELGEALLVKDSLPSFLVDFLDRYDTTAARLHNFPSLYASLYREMESKSEGFLRSFYQFEREVRLVLTALRAKKWGRDLVRELQFEDPHDPFVMQILAQKDASDYSPPQEYEALKALFVENSSDPLKLYRALLEYRFNKILEMEEQCDSFSVDRILGFLARLMIVEMWNGLDRDRGLTLVDDISKNG